MVKSYLRYEPSAAFGVIASVGANIAFDNSGNNLLSPALENVAVWHVRRAVCSKTLALLPESSSRGSSLAVTSIAVSPSNLVASGYADGSIRIWDSEKGSCEAILNGHKGAVTALRFSKLGSTLASGGKDNDVNLWDVVGQSGLFRLRGHKDQVTDVVFLDSDKKLVSSSKDKFLRVWDLDTQHCMQTVGGHHSEIWSIDVDPEENYLVTGSADPEIRVYMVKNESVNSGGDSSTKDKWSVLKLFGELQRQQVNDRVATVRFNKTGSLLASQVAGKIVEIFRVLDEAESKRKAKRRIHRKKEKKSAKGKDESEAIGSKEKPNEKGEGNNLEVTVPDVFKLLHTIRAGKKICSISFSPKASKNSLATIALSLNNNMLEFYSIKSDEVSKSVPIELQGHRSDIRSVTLSSDNTFLMSTSHSAIKIWNPSTGTCLNTIDSEFGLCGLLVPQSKYGIVGTKSGKLEVVDIASGTCNETVEAHGGAVRSIAAIPDENRFVTGSADKDVKIWEYKASQKSAQDSKHLKVSNVKTMKMDEDVLAVAISPDAKYIAIALLNNVVKVYYLDSLKWFLDFFGHKLPVLCMDISSDSELLVTGSADKDLKIWGLDFGDCHKSIYAHEQSVTAVKFVGNTHYLFSVGKDNRIKYWDADKFQLLLTLDGHHADIWCLAVSNRGEFIVTGSHDRSIRRWDRTDEPFFIEEERERTLEEKFEADIDNMFEGKSSKELPEEGAVALAGKKSKETLSATDAIIDALDIAQVELTRMAEHEEEKSRGKVSEFQPNRIMLGLSPTDYVLRALSSVRTNDLEQTLVALPYTDAVTLLAYLKDWITNPDKVELVGRIAAVLFQTHCNQLISNPTARRVVSDLKEILYKRIKGCNNTIGFNQAAMEHIMDQMALRSDVPLQDAKAKLVALRLQHSKRLDARTETGDEKRKKKKTKK